MTPLQLPLRQGKSEESPPLALKPVNLGYSCLRRSFATCVHKGKALSNQEHNRRAEQEQEAKKCLQQNSQPQVLLSVHATTVLCERHLN